MKKTSIAILIASMLSTPFSLIAKTTEIQSVNFATTKQNSHQEQIFAERQDLIRGQLENGLTYVIAPNLQSGKRATVQLIVHSGSLDEENDQLGIAHLVEHMAFNGTEDFPANSMIEHQESLGMMFGRDVNAMTEKHSTSYYFHLPNNTEKMLKEAFHMLSQQAFAQVFDAEELEKERPVVEEEWRSRRGMMTRLAESTTEILLENSRYAKRSPIGDMELVRQVDAKRIKDFWQAWYHPNNMSLVVVGDVKQEQIMPLLNEYFASVPAKDLPPRSDNSVHFSKGLSAAYFADPEMITEVVSINFRGYQAPALSLDSLRAELLNSLAMDMLNKRLNESYQTEGEHLSRVVAGTQHLTPDFNNNRVVGIVKEQNYAKAYAELFAQISMFKKHGFTQADLVVAKADALQYQHRVAQNAKKRTNRQLVMDIFSMIRLKHPVIDANILAKETEALLAKISLEEVNHAFATMLDERSPVAITQLKEKNLPNLPSEPQVIALWQQAFANPPELAHKQTEIKPIFTQELKLVEPIAEQKLDNVYLWQFANGASVWFQPSEKSQQNLLLSWQGFGGSQQLPAAQLRASQLAGLVMPSFGYGGLSDPELDTANAGKAVSMTPYIGSLEHSITGTTIAADLEVWLQNMYLMMREPQADAAVWQARKNRIMRDLSQEIKSADKQYREAIAKIRDANYPSLLPVTLDEIEPISEQDLLAAWKTYFGYAAGRQLVIVGNADTEKVKALVSRYIGNLPAGKAQTDGTIPKFWSGQHQVRINAGNEPKGMTGLYYNLDYPYSLNVERQGNLVSRVVRNHLLKAIREQASGTYSPNVSIHLERERQQLYASISYGHQPERAEELMQITQRVLAELLKTGISQSELNEIKEQQRNLYKLDNIQDKQRFAWLSNSARNNLYTPEPNGYLQWLETIQPAQLNALLTNLFSSKNVIDARMGPAKLEPAEQK